MLGNELSQHATLVRSIIACVSVKRLKCPWNYLWGSRERSKASSVVQGLGVTEVMGQVVREGAGRGRGRGRGVDSGTIFVHVLALFGVGLSQCTLHDLFCRL